MKSIIKQVIESLISEKQQHKLKQYVNKARFFGFNYKCVMCNSDLRTLKPFGLKFPVLTEKNIIGGGYRSSAQCPVCYSTDRERLLYLYLSKKTDFFSKKTKVKVLHVAPEPNLSSIIKMQSNIDYLSADISANNVMIKMDITKINYPEETFDVILCNHVLEHVVDDRRAMRELYRVLKTGGWAILQVPISLSLEKTYEDFSVTDPSERETLFGQSDHVRIYSMDYVDRLRESGFNVSIFSWQKDPEFCESDNKYGLLESENIFVVKK